MMTVKDLIEQLECVLADNDGKDMEVIIGMEQEYGCDWAYDIDDEVRIRPTSFFYEKDREVCVIKMNGQIGQVDFSEDEEEW